MKLLDKLLNHVFIPCDELPRVKVSRLLGFFLFGHAVPSSTSLTLALFSRSSSGRFSCFPFLCSLAFFSWDKHRQLLAKDTCPACLFVKMLTGTVFTLGFKTESFGYKDPNFQIKFGRFGDFKGQIGCFMPQLCYFDAILGKNDPNEGICYSFLPEGL